ncbi:hypothetical protein [Mycobacterium sp.]
MHGLPHTITVPDSVTFGDVAEAISRTTGRTIRHVDEKWTPASPMEANA